MEQGARQGREAEAPAAGPYTATLSEAPFHWPHSVSMKDPHIQSHPSSVPETKIKDKVSFGTFFPSEDMLLCSMLALLMATALRNGVEGKGGGG